MVRHPLALCAVVLLAACEDKVAKEQQPPLPTASIPGVYAGVFPCDTCDGIDATLWLRADGRFFFRQQYAATADRDVLDVVSLGRWRIIADGRQIEIAGEGPVRTLARSGDNVLDLQNGSSLPHQLLRDESLPGIEIPFRMQGNMRLRADGAVFSECLTGLAAPVDKTGDYRRFLHQYRGADISQQEIPVELIGHFAWANDGGPQAFIVNRFVTFKPDLDC